MKNVSLGSTDLDVSQLCLGTMQFGWTTDEDSANAVMDAFVEADGNFIDTADVYSSWAEGNPGGVSEEVIGRWMKLRRNRESIVLATKVRGRMWDGPDGEGLSRKHIVRAVEDSLRRLQVDTIDLYQCHSSDEKTPIEETLRAFEELLKSGKVRHIGASNFPLPMIEEAFAVAKQNNLPAFEVLQPHHSLVHRNEFEDGLQQFCIEHEMGVIPYSPLAGGFLTGKYEKGGERVRSQRSGGVKKYFTDDGWAVLDAVRSVATAHDTTPAAVALAWQMAQPGITAPIVGANTPEQLADQLPGVGLELSAPELAQLDKASNPFLRHGEFESK